MLTKQQKIKADTYTKFESVKNQTTEEYFNGNEFSIDAFNRKYAAFPGETYVQAVKRVCDYAASSEISDEQIYWAERWFDEIYNDWWHPAGSIMQGANSGKKISLFNCTTISLGVNREDEEWDNLESIFKNTAYTVAKAAAYRQGLGVDFSRLRPAGASVLNSANISTGAIHWMKFIDSIGYYVGQKGRIPAMLFSISCEHPDVLDFIKIKGNRKDIQNANISVQCTDAFYKAVENNEEWELKFEIPEIKVGQKVYININSKEEDSLYDEKIGKWYYIAKKDRPYEKTSSKIKARAIAELIAQNMCNHAEPGIQNIDIAHKYSNSDYVYDSEDEYDSRIVSTNACSEQYLSKDSCCVLSSINAGKFPIDNESLETELDKIGHSINRFLDNINEMELRDNTYVTPHQKLAIQKLRRTGAGLTNLAAWLFKKNLEYGSELGNQAVEHFTKTYNYYLYKSSIELGHEKGSFGLFKQEKFEKSPFVKRMMGLNLKFDAMRNVTCSSIAPTGTLSLMFRENIFSYGIEPAFGVYFWKRSKISGKYEYYFCVPKIVKEIFANHGLKIPMQGETIRDTWDGKNGMPIAEFIDENAKKINLKFKRADQVNVLEKLDLMSKVMKWVDSSISVTYLLPENSDWKDVYKLILEAHKKEVKSIAAFPDKKMYGIVSFTPFKDLAIKLSKEGMKIKDENFTTHEIEEIEKVCQFQSEQKIGERPEILVDVMAPKRPKALLCDIHHLTVDGKQWTAMIGLFDKKPYEMFLGYSEQLSLPKKYKSGSLVKHGKGKYALHVGEGDDELIIKDIIVVFNNAQAAWTTRLISLSLRHGVNVSFVVEQLVKDGKFNDINKVLARVLKKYIPEGEIVKSNNACSCGSNNFKYSEGCMICLECGNTKCS